MPVWNHPLRGNDLEHPVAKLCLLLEEDRRTPSGRIRSSKQFREHYFSFDDRAADDRIFRFMPADVRGPIIAAWGIRGPRSASKDSDDRVRTVVQDAFLAGDIDDFLFEEGLTPTLVVRWGELSDWWSFWRRGPITRHAMRKALESGFGLGLFDAAWFIDNLRSKGGTLEGTDVIAEGLSKAELATWIRAVYRSGDSSASGLIGALGWDSLASKLPDDAILHVLDTLAERHGLVEGPHSRSEPPIVLSADELEVERLTPVPGEEEATPPSGIPALKAASIAPLPTPSAPPLAAPRPISDRPLPVSEPPPPLRARASTLPAIPPPMPLPPPMPPPPPAIPMAVEPYATPPSSLPAPPPHLPGLMDDDDPEEEVPGRYSVVSNRSPGRPSQRPEAPASLRPSTPPGPQKA